MSNLYNEINNNFEFSELLVNPDLNDEELDNNEQIIFANIKNYYVSDYDIDDNCDEYTCKRKYNDCCEDDDDDESHDENSEKCKKKKKKFLYMLL